MTEIPYMVNKAKLIEKIAELVQDKRVEGISDIRDESDRDGMRIVIELKRDANAQVVLNYLYKHTQLQDTFGAIMLALVDGEPQDRSPCKQIISPLPRASGATSSRRRTQYDLRQGRGARPHPGRPAASPCDHIDEVIALIRASRTTAQDAKDGLMERFGLSERAGAGHPGHAPGTPHRPGARQDSRPEYAELQKQIA